MYCDFYQLRERPFNVTADPKFLYLNARYREALASLNYGITQRKGFITLIGEAGTGKTTLLKKLLDDLDNSTRTVFIFNTNVSFDEILEYIFGEFDLPVQNGKRLYMLQTAERLPARRAAAGTQCRVADRRGAGPRLLRARGSAPAVQPGDGEGEDPSDRSLRAARAGTEDRQPGAAPAASAGGGQLPSPAADAGRALRVRPVAPDRRRLRRSEAFLARRGGAYLRDFDGHSPSRQHRLRQCAGDRIRARQEADRRGRRERGGCRSAIDRVARHLERDRRGAGAGRDRCHAARPQRLPAGRRRGRRSRDSDRPSVGRPQPVAGQRRVRGSGDVRAARSRGGSARRACRDGAESGADPAGAGGDSPRPGHGRRRCRRGVAAGGRAPACG